MIDINNIYHGDCLDLMSSIDDKSINLILCDLPYGVTANQSWDKIIDFKQLWKQYNRIIKDNGAIVLTATEPFRTKLIFSNLKMFKYDLIWEKNKTSGFLNAKKQPLRKHESILVFYKKQPTYHPQKTQGHKPAHSFTKHTSDGDNYGKTQLGFSGGGQTDRYPTSIIKISVVNNDSDEKIHPAQKPVELGEYLINTYSNIGDIILDNACGSGSFLLAAKNLNRHFIGMDINKIFVDLSRKRLCL